ncbi:cilia- and flagella-associated protein 263 [Lepisosteus oculatus]|uniref:cilia- and flagella-associated protein 263 n=1 Tax=Lepisosteus oculatus TaxID=7918 RepID=UPI00074043D9|nr:PREDICTED: coiled-coil domain-containing protein 113 [Lepisosteus oculatus]
MAEAECESQADDNPEFSELGAHELVLLVEELSRSNGVLKAETEMFQRYISRLDPKDLAPAAAAEPTLGVSQAEVTQGQGQARGRSKSKSRSFTAERLQRLTVEQKCDVAQRELEETREDLGRLKEASERVLNNYRATTEEADIRLVEIKKATYEFERDVARVLQEKRGVMMGAEKVVRYIEDRTRAKDTLAEKLRLKNAALKVQKKKLQMQLRQKEEMGEALHEVDFQQLKIENSQYLEKIDERNQDLLRLKLLAGSTLQVLNSFKKKLQSTTHESNLLDNEIASRRDMLVKIEAEAVQAEEERAKAEALNRRLRGQLSDYRVPQVLEYVHGKVRHCELEQSVRVWERKVEISEMALKTHLKAWNKLKASSGQQQDWVPA